MSKKCADAVEPEAAGDAARSGAVRASRATKWRIAVLVAVHLAIVAHVVHWKLAGKTLSPLEPSEAMQFTRTGLINAGAILFAAAILLTLVFGRWFCGWTCHLVAVQDLCYGLLKKFGLQPRAVNLGVLGLVPWILFVYMFVSALVYRALEGHPLGTTHVDLQTENFWATFPGWVMALTSYAVCGFAIVYFLGAKGFCTYGCPYGGIFGVVDQLAPLRIRVTDACSGCGHCTVACTSNVRVHQEVRDWKAVVDPGCMKCLDCVSVCPKDALYVGFAAPALWTSRRSQSKAVRRSWDRERVARVALSAAFLWSSLVVLFWHAGQFEPRLALILAAGALVIALVFAGKAERGAGPTLGEELFVCGAFLLALYVYRGIALFPGLPDAVPLLLSVGIAAIAAYLALVALRCVRRSNVSLQNFALVRERRWTRAGVGFAVVVTVGFAASMLGGWQQLESDRELIARKRTEREARRALEQAQPAYRRGVEHAERGEFSAAIGAFEEALALAPQFAEARENLAGMLCAVGRYDEGIAHYLAALRSRPDDADTFALLGRAYAEKGEFGAAESAWNSALALVPDHASAHEGLALLCERRGDAACAREHRDAARRASETSRR